jgi:hypothetical protein
MTAQMRGNGWIRDGKRPYRLAARRMAVLIPSARKDGRSDGI